MLVSTRSRPSRLGGACLALLALLAFSACERAPESVAPAAPEANRPPNIIYIYADDLGYGDIGPYGQQLIQTPKLDRMAEEGMKFTQHYAGSTVCAPSRNVLMTGEHTGKTLIRGNAKIAFARRTSPWPRCLKARATPMRPLENGAWG